MILSILDPIPKFTASTWPISHDDYPQIEIRVIPHHSNIASYFSLQWIHPDSRSGAPSPQRSSWTSPAYRDNKLFVENSQFPELFGVSY